MRFARLIVRAFVLVVVTAVLELIWLLGKLLLVPFGKARRRWRGFTFCGWARIVARTIGMRVEVSGDPPLSPFFLVSNHLSYIDAVAFASRLNCVFVVKREVRSWPVIGWIAASTGTIFIDRDNFQDIPRAMSLINKTIDDGLGIVLFPEGTSTMGDRVLPFNPALLEPAVRANYPVSYASISYCTPPGEVPAYESVCWWGEMSFLPHLGRMLKLSGFVASLSFGSHAIHADDRKTLARSLWNAVNDQFIPACYYRIQEK